MDEEAEVAGLLVAVGAGAAGVFVLAGAAVGAAGADVEVASGAAAFVAGVLFGAVAASPFVQAIPSKRRGNMRMNRRVTVE
jgi:hypothetical protein